MRFLFAIVALALSAAGVHAQRVQVTIRSEATGSFYELMSTSFQAAPWTDAAFVAHPEIPSLLSQLDPHHIRVQVIDASIPQSAPEKWDFSALDRQLQPILTAADHSPEIQLAQAPAYLYRSKTNSVTPAFVAGYAAYAAGMVRHYNAPGNQYPIRYWGILNEPNYFNISPADYVRLYNAAVPAMLAVDPTIRIVALELGGESQDEQRYVPAFVHGVKGQVDVIALHLYSTCDREASDQVVFASIPGFVQQISTVRHTLDRNPAFRRIPIWVAENNVNADFIDAGGHSPCHPQRKFAEDERGSSSFFAAWRADAFSQFGKAGSQALYHWVFMGDRQYAEYNTEDSPAHLQIGFWIDHWLGRYFPADANLEKLAVDNPAPHDLEVLATRGRDGSVSILLANRRVNSPSDQNGRGRPLEVTVDMSSLARAGAQYVAHEVSFGPDLDLAKGPQEKTVTMKPKMQFRMPGYGVVLLSLVKTSD